MRWFILLTVVLNFSLPARAQPVVEDLAALLRLADERSPTAQQAALQSAMARQEKKAQGSLLYPRISAFGTADYYPLLATQLVPAEFLGGDPGTFLRVQFGLPYVYTGGAEVALPLIHPENWAQVSRASSQYEQREWGSQAARENLHIQLIQGYYQALALREVLALNEENDTTTRELLRIMTERYRQQVIEPADYNRTRNLALEVQAAQIDGELDYETTLNNLIALLGTDTLVLPESLRDFDWPAGSEGDNISHRPAWREAVAGVRTAELSLREARSGSLPELSLVGRYSFNHQTDTDEATESISFGVANVGVRLNVPLFRGGYHHALAQNGRLQLEHARREQERVRANLTQQQKDWRAQYQAAYEKHGILEEKVRATRENLRIALLNVKEDVMEFDQFYDIFLEHNRARIDYLRNLASGLINYQFSTQNFE